VSALFEARDLLPESLSIRLAVPSSIVAAPIKSSRGIRLCDKNRGKRAQVLPIALPSLAYDTDRGAFRVKRDALELSQSAKGRRCWLPLLVSWDAARNRSEATWRVLTVSERSKAVPVRRAFAARVSWGRHESFVIYHSFKQPSSRAFLGYRTHSRFLMGLFTSDGNVTPIVRID
jgi:hypothetical protein